LAIGLRAAWPFGNGLGAGARFAGVGDFAAAKAVFAGRAAIGGGALTLACAVGFAVRFAGLECSSGVTLCANLSQASCSSLLSPRGWDLGARLIAH
jgi:hypothetical protein